jgi:predicted DNA-binding transcriptional regulator YafY
VVVRHGRWYLLCRSVRSDATRAYRIDRVRSVEELNDIFVPPDLPDPVSALEEHLGLGWEYDVEVLIDGPLDKVGRCIPRELGRLEALEDGRTRLVGSTSNPTWYAEKLAAVPATYRIISGAEVREAVGRLGRRLLAAGEEP